MKRLPFLLVLLICVGAWAQNPPTGSTSSVVLTWNAPSPVGGSGTVAGYNIYRTSSGANFSQINTSLVTATTMTDTAVVAGTTYGYCGTTVDSAGRESACTIPVNANVPSNPNPPRGFQAASQ